jgi:cation transporter-like permease
MKASRVTYGAVLKSRSNTLQTICALLAHYPSFIILFRFGTTAHSFSSHGSTFLKQLFALGLMSSVSPNLQNRCLKPKYRSL